MSANILMLCGPIGVGKTTLAKAVAARVATHRMRCKHVSFAAPIKQALVAMAGLNVDDALDIAQHMKDAEFIKTGKTWRQVMQSLGTEWGRNLVHEDIWAQLACAAIPPNQHVVIDDLRFHSEAAVVRSQFPRTTVVRLHRAGISAGEASHASESEWATMPNAVDWTMPDIGCCPQAEAIYIPDYNHIVNTLALQLVRRS